MPSRRNAAGSVIVIHYQGPTPIIRSTGSSQGVSETVVVTVRRTQEGEFGYALFGADYLQIGGTGAGVVTVDSYNSNLGDGKYGHAISPPDATYGSWNQSQVQYPATLNGTIGTNDSDYDSIVDLQLGSLSYPNTGKVYGKAYLSEWTNNLNEPNPEVAIFGINTLGNGGLPIKQPAAELPPITVPSDLTTKGRRPTVPPNGSCTSICRPKSKPTATTRSGAIGSGGSGFEANTGWSM